MKKNRYRYLIFFLLVCSFLIECDSKPNHEAIKIQKIVSLAPSITETLFALGLGDKVVGITRYCAYPPEAQEIEKIGGYTDANLEKIVTLKPDVAILENEHEKQRSFLARYGIRTLTVSFGTLKDIRESFGKIGEFCGTQEKSDSLIATFDSIFSPTITSNKPGQKILICVGRDSPGMGKIQGVYAAGAGTFYNELILAAGGINAFADSIPRYPKLSKEGIITIAPDIIIDIAPSMDDVHCSDLIEDWKSFTMIPAARNNQVYCFSAGYATIPGPRLILLLKDLKEIIR